MTNFKNIAATLAILGSGALLVGCEKKGETTEVPGAADGAGAGDAASDAAAGDAAEAKCGEGHAEEGHCGAPE